MGSATHNQLDPEQVKARCDILAVVGGSVELQQRGHEWRGLCPFHAEKTPSFSVNPDKRTWHCFGCGRGGDVLSFVMELQHITFGEALEQLAGYQPPPDYVPPRPRAAAPGSAGGEGDKAREWGTQTAGLRPLDGTQAMIYLAGRGIPSAALQGCGCKYHPTWFGRPAVVFPLRATNGRLVAAQGRYIDGRKPRMRTAQPYSGAAGLGVFSTPGAFDAKILVIVEGPINALSLAVAGLPAVATCGASHFAPWLPEVCAGKVALIAFDTDAAGATGGGKLAKALTRSGVIVYELPILQPGVDWNDLLCRFGTAAMREALQRALSRITTARAPGYTDLLAGYLGNSVRVESSNMAPGALMAVNPPCEGWPAGWCEVLTDDLLLVKVDPREIYDASGHPLAHQGANGKEVQQLA